MESGDRSGGVRQSRSDQTFRLRRNTATPTDLNSPLFTPIFYLLTPIWAKHNPPLAPLTNGGLTSRLDYSICLPRAFLDLPFGCWGHWELRGLPIHKTSLHADVCSGSYQNSILVCLIIVRCVSSLGSSGVSLVLRNSSRGFRTVQGFDGIF